MNLALGLNRDEFDAEILCFRKGGAYFEKVEKSGLPLHVQNVVTPLQPIFTFPFRLWKTVRLFRKIKPDVIHSFHYKKDFTEALAARIAGCKWIYVKKNMKWGSLSWHWRTRLAHHVIAQNTDMLKEFFANSKKVTLIPRGVNTHDYQPRPFDKALATSLGLHENQTILLLVANLFPVKGVEILFKAAQERLKNDPDTIILVVGDDEIEYANTLKAWVKENKLDHQIRFTGKRMDVDRFYSLATLFVLPTLNEGRKEGSPVALLEAMSAGCLCIASAVPGIKDQLAPFPDHLFEAANVGQLSERLTTFLSKSDQERKKLGQAMRDEVLAHHTIQREINQHEAVYRLVASQT